MRTSSSCDKPYLSGLRRHAQGFAVLAAGSTNSAPGQGAMPGPVPCDGELDERPGSPAAAPGTVTRLASRGVAMPLDLPCSKSVLPGCAHHPSRAGAALVCRVGLGISASSREELRGV